MRTAKALMIVAALSGGSLFTSCLGRVRTAAVDGSKSFFFSVLNQTSTDIVSNLANTGP